jgi:hypothetical protein
MNSTSRGSRLVSSAARSPGRSSTGPEVWRRLTPISRAMMCASVVLPRPGGPNSSTWSSASPRAARGLDEDRELVAHLLLADVVETSCANTSMLTPERIASAMRGPTPDTFSRFRNRLRSASLPKPNSSSASSRTTWWISSRTRSPTGGNV